MLKRHTLILSLLLCSNIKAQTISNVDFSAIQREVTDTSSVFYYPDLLERFKLKDSTLSFLDYQHLYYGAVLQDFYAPYEFGKDFEKFNELYHNEQFKKAIKHGLKAFDNNPVNLRLIFRIAVAYMATNNKATAQQYAQLYYRLLDVIYSSGDGKSPETAFVVIQVADEYEIVAELKLQVKEQHLSGETDVLKFSTKGQEHKPKIKQLHFNVHFPLQYLAKSFNLENNE